MNQLQRASDMPTTDNSSTFEVFEAEAGATPAQYSDPYCPQTLKGQTVDSYAVDRDKIAKVKQLAIHLGRHKADLICEGLELVLEKYRDKLDELLASQQPNDAAKQ